MKSKLICLAVAVILAGCSQEPVSQIEEIVTPVTVMTVEPSEISSAIVYAGQTAPLESVAVASKIGGKISKVFFDVGDRVKAGDVLFTLDEADLRNQIRQLEGQLNIAAQAVKTAENAMSSVKGGQYSSQVLQLEAAVDSSERQVESASLGLRNSEIAMGNALDGLDNATTSYNNAKLLYEAGSMSKSDFDRAELGYKQAQAALEQAQVANNSAKLALEQAELGLNQARDSLTLTTGDVTDENLQRARLGVSQAEASREAVAIQLDIARETLGDTAIKAPITGVVSARSAKPAEYTSTQMAAFTLVNIEKVNVNVKVSELLINMLEQGQAVDVSISSASDTPFKGKLTSISPAADATSMYPVKIELENSQGFIKPGMFAEVSFIRAAASDAVVLPRNAVLENGRELYVFTESGGTAVKTVVSTGIDNGREIEITSGLSRGDRVIIKGQTYLSDGDKINVIE